MISLIIGREREGENHVTDILDRASQKGGSRVLTVAGNVGGVRRAAGHQLLLEPQSGADRVPHPACGRGLPCPSVPITTALLWSFWPVRLTLGERYHERLMRGWERGREQLPPGYCLDTSDTAVWVLRRADSTAVARFSAWGAIKEMVEQVAKRDHMIGSDGRGRRRDRPRWSGDAAAANREGSRVTGGKRQNAVENDRRS